MTPNEWMTLVLGVIALLLNAMVLAVGYGVLKGTVRAIELRVQTLETEIQAVNALAMKVTRVETTLDFMLEQMKDLNASIRWMRDPALPYQNSPK